MKIAIDLQGAQTESRFRGIGRYSLSLAKAVAATALDHEVYIVLNKNFPGTIEPIRAAFQHLLPQERIRAFSVPDRTAELGSADPFRVRAAEILREQFLAGLRPDVVLLSTFFEGFGNDAVTSIGLLPHTYLSAVVLYDLIPLAMPQDHLRDYVRARWYQRKLEQLKQADLMLTVSEFSKEEAIRLVEAEPRRIAMAGAAVDDIFRKLHLAEYEQDRIRTRMGISKPFVLSVASANERRKNTVGLLQAFAMLPQDIRSKYQLVVSGSSAQPERDAILRQAREVGLVGGDVVITGYITDDDLVALYNLCSLFVFPSLYEGFGLPVLEAMACGAPTICSEAASLPEVIGYDEALFDPASPSAMAARILQVLTDSVFADRLVLHGMEQAARFSWTRTAELALAACEDALGRKRASLQPARAYVGTGTGKCAHTAIDVCARSAGDPVEVAEVGHLSASNSRKLTLGFVSPLPPEQTGIASYSAELLPALGEYYDIEVVTERGGGDTTSVGGAYSGAVIRTPQWFEQHADRYDRVLYQVGNSPFHLYQLDLLERHPGVVVLHDFVLEGLYRGLEAIGGHPLARVSALYHSHGYEGVTGVGGSTIPVSSAFPINRSVCEDALGVIVHSEYARGLAARYYGDGAGADWAVVPQLRGIPVSADTSRRGSGDTALRRQMGL
ncbi:MAG: glycosyltransferase family 4 protein, partial [Acidimicrobiales bacterium]